MWVYQEQTTPEPITHAPTAPKALPETPAERKEDQRPIRPVETDRGGPQREAERAGGNTGHLEARPAVSRATRDCVLLAAAYLLGTAAAGVLQALCDAKELEILAYYLERWRALFDVSGAESAAALFGAEYLAVAGAVTVLLLMGLSALGPTLIFLFVMLYGTGSGLVTVQMIAGLGWKQALVYFLFAGVPAAAAAGCLCLFGAAALQVSSRLHAFSFSARSRGAAPAGARVLVGQYLLTAVVLVPVCGAATGLSVLAAHLPLG